MQKTEAQGGTHDRLAPHDPTLPHRSPPRARPPQSIMPEPTERLVVVSNRLPVTIKMDPSVPGGFAFSKSSGGLVSALRGTKKTMDFTWIGWPGLSVPLSSIPYIETTLREEYQCKPVWIPDELAERHYNGFSNSILWPLFHYHPGEMNFDEENWLAYREANKRFAETVRSVLRPGDRVWVQDYHLMLLPLMLSAILEGNDIDEIVPGDCAKIGMAHGSYLDLVSESIAEDSHTPESSLRRKDIKIGFFLHTPFPSSEVYRYVYKLTQYPACAARDPARHSALRPDWLPYVRLCAPLSLVVRAHPRPADLSQRRRLLRAPRAGAHLPHRHRARAV